MTWESDPPARPARAPTAGRSPLAAALLNLSGLSAGYLYLRRWWRGLIHLAVTVALLALAATRDAAARPLPWAVLLGLWAAWTVWDGWRQARRHNPTWTFTPGELRARPVLAGGVVLVVVAGALLQYRAAGDRTLAAALDRHRAADCQAAVDGYQRVTTLYELTLSPSVATADARRPECAALLEAEAAGRGGFEAAVAAYQDHQEQYPDGLLAEPVASRLRDTYVAWAASLRQEGRYEEAFEVYQEARDAFADLPVDDEVAETLAAWAMALREDGRHLDAVGRYLALHRDYPDSAPAEQVPQAIADTYAQAVRALPGQAPCDAIELHRRFTNRPAPVPESVVAQARRALPQATYDCAVWLYDQERYGDAIDHLEQVAEAGGPLAEQARALAREADLMLIRSTAADAQGSGIPLGPALPAGSAPGGTVLVEIVSTPPFVGAAAPALDVYVSGPTTMRASVPQCDACNCGIALGTGQGPSLTLELEPGTYDVAVNSLGLDTPFAQYAGTWELDGGLRYVACF